MGLGDWIMATAQAKRENEKHGLRCVFTNGNKHFYEPDIFKGNRRIAENLLPGERYVAIPDYPGCRPYIKGYGPDRFIWDEHFKATPGELYLTAAEKRLPLEVPYVLIEPGVKGKDQRNKDWGWENWQQVAKAPFPFLQIGQKGNRLLDGIPFLETSFRQALGMLYGASLLVTTDGALHHAAAALGVPAVVIWGGFTSPENLGYDSHRNLWAGVDPCGIWKDSCQHCRDALNAIKPAQVIDAIGETLERSERHLVA